MADRDDILAAVRRNKPRSTVETPRRASAFETSRGASVRGGEALLQSFIDVVKEIGGDVAPTERDQVPVILEERYPDMKPVYAEEAKAIKDVDQLAAMNLFVCEGVLGVAENGAIWIPESHMGARIAPFIAQHAAIILVSTQIVADMHEAYARIDVAADGFGLFVAGPSKTADIEQSLVLGAHGPRSLLVLLV